MEGLERASCIPVVICCRVRCEVYFKVMGRKRTIPKWVSSNVSEPMASSQIFRFQTKFPNGHVEEIDLFADLDIDYDILETHLEEIPAQYMFWAAVYSELKSMVAIAEMKVDRRRAALTKEILEQFKTKAIKLTDKQLTNLIAIDDKLATLQVELAATQKKTGKVYHMVEAIRLRSEHCRSLAGFKRQDKEQSGHQT